MKYIIIAVIALFVIGVVAGGGDKEAQQDTSSPNTSSTPEAKSPEQEDSDVAPKEVLIADIIAIAKDDDKTELQKKAMFEPFRGNITVVGFIERLSEKPKAMSSDSDALILKLQQKGISYPTLYCEIVNYDDSFLFTNKGAKVRVTGIGVHHRAFKTLTIKDATASVVE